MHRPQPTQAITSNFSGKYEYLWLMRLRVRSLRVGLGLWPEVWSVYSLNMQVSHIRARLPSNPSISSWMSKQWQVGQRKEHIPHDKHLSENRSHIVWSYSDGSFSGMPSWSSERLILS